MNKLLGHILGNPMLADAKKLTKPFLHCGCYCLNSNSSSVSKTTANKLTCGASPLTFTLCKMNLRIENTLNGKSILRKKTPHICKKVGARCSICGWRRRLRYFLSIIRDLKKKNHCDINVKQQKIQLYIKNSKQKWERERLSQTFTKCYTWKNGKPSNRGIQCRIQTAAKAAAVRWQLIHLEINPLKFRTSIAILLQMT